MKKRLTFVGLVSASSLLRSLQRSASPQARAPTRSTDANIVGAGSSFAAPLFTAWYQYYNPKSERT